MIIAEITEYLESFAPLHLQESYDNSGLITGNSLNECTGIIISLDAIEDVVNEAIRKNCNLIVTHHPIIFNGLKKITGKNYVERTIIAAIKNDIAIYAIHTNLDNVLKGVNKKIVEKLNLKNIRPLEFKKSLLKKLITFSPIQSAKKVRTALFNAGAGHLGKYSECSFNNEGTGTFKAGEDAKPYVGKIGERHEEKEIKIEVIFQSHLQNKIMKALIEAHPYEEVAYDIVPLDNFTDDVGSGLIGDIQDEVDEEELLHKLKTAFNLQVIRHTKFIKKNIVRIAVCGGAGSFLILQALANKADVFITADVKYHEFFDADEKMLLIDIGHYESEQFTIDLLSDILREKYSNFAVLKTEIKTNPVNYFV